MNDRTKTKAQLMAEAAALRRRVAELEALEQLYWLDTAMQEAPGLEERLRLVLRGVQEVVGFERAVIWLPRPDEQHLEATAWVGFDMPEGGPVRLPIDGGAPILSRAYREGAEIILDASRPVPAEYRVPEPYPRISLIRSRGPAVLPLVSRGRCVGLLAADNARSRRPGTPNLEVLRTLVANAAGAIDSARLYADLEERLAQVEALSAVGAALVEERDLERVLRTVAEQVLHLLEAAGCAIALLDPGETARPPGEELELAVVVGADESLQGRRLPLAGSFSGEAIRTGRPVVSEDAQHDPRAFAPVARAQAGRAVLSIPLQTRERTVGAITVHDPRSATGAARFGPRDVEIMTLFARQAAVAIANARLHAAARQELAERQRAEAALRASETLYRTLLESADDDIHVKDAEGRYLVVNPAMARRLGRPQEDFLGKTALEVYPGAIGAKIRADDLRVLREGAVVEAEDVFPDRVALNRKVPLRDADGRVVGIVTIARDITGRKRAEEALRRQNEYLAALQETALGLLGRLELGELLEAVIARAAALVGTFSGSIWLLEPGEEEMQLRVSVGRYREAVGARLEPGEGLAGKVWQTGEPLIVDDYQTWAGRSPDPRFAMLHAAVGLPLKSEAEVVGVITLAREEAGCPFDAGVIEILSRFAHLASVALDNARLYAAAQREIAERTRVEAALREAERRFRAIVEASPIPTLISRVSDGTVLYSNEPTAALLGLPNGALVGRRTPDFYYDPADRPRVLERVRRDGQLRDYELHARRADGSPLWVSLSVQPMTYGGEPAVLASLLDITERKRAEEALRASEGRHRAVVDTASDAIVTMSVDGRIRSFNRGAERIFGYPAAEAIGRPLTVLMPDRFHGPHTAGLERYLATGRARALGRTLELVGRRRDGAEFPLELSIAEVRGEAERLFTGILRDISERKRFEAELRRAHAAAEAANQAKSGFLATMSHEIRTPMNGVIGMAGLLLDTELTPEQREYAETIRGCGEALLTIINDILDFSKIEAGKLELERQPFDLRDCLESALDLVAARAAEKGLDLACEIAEGVPAAILGDVTRLRQVLLNLLSNAVKFTERGEVVLTVAARAAGGRRHELHLSVRDTGIGIPADRIDRLFQSFSQVDASTTRKYGGTGLGLAISHRLCALMGGAMWVESEVGRGATFHVTLAAEAAPEVPGRADLRGEQPHLAGKRLLVVDDNATNRRIVVQHARAWGMLARDTASPGEALVWVRRGDPFDVAILDMQMPELDGVALARAIRAHRDARALPLILCSSLGRREAGAEGVGFAAHLAKPLKASQLCDALAGIFAAQAPPVRQADAPPVLDPGMAARLPLRILVAEDNAVNQKLALRLLGRLGYRADVAGNGLEVLAAIERQRYDVVLMDVQMPELDGLEAARRICARWPRGVRPRIVAMTANAMQGDREACLAAGMDDYVGKPIRVDELVAALSRCQPLPTAVAAQSP